MLTESCAVHSVMALEDSVLAEIPNDAFLAFVEGLGSRVAKKVSRYMADLVLSRVIYHEAEASREDRRRLFSISVISCMRVSERSPSLRRVTTLCCA